MITICRCWCCQRLWTADFQSRFKDKSMVLTPLWAIIAYEEVGWMPVGYYIGQKV